MKLDGLLWLAVPLVAVGLWLAHDGLQHREQLALPRTPNLFPRLQDYLVQADLDGWTARRLLSVCLLSGTLTGVLAQALLGWPLATVVASVVGVLGPVRWVQTRHARVHAETRAGLAAALGQLAESLAVGQTIERGAQTLAREGPVRLRAHFAQFCGDAESQDLGRAAVRFRDRLADPVVDLFVAGLLLHVELGGDDFRPMLGQLEKMTRSQQAIREEVAATRARLRFSAYVLVAAPVLILLVLRSWSPVVAAFFDSAEGMETLLVCALCLIGGYMLMLYLGRLPTEERVLVR
jgi:Flp pilus assembly protein TadB